MKKQNEITGLEWILKDVRRAIGVANSEEDPHYKIGYMLSALKTAEEYLKQLDTWNQGEEFIDPDPFGVIAALDEALKIR